MSAQDWALTGGWAVAAGLSARAALHSPAVLRRPWFVLTGLGVLVAVDKGADLQTPLYRAVVGWWRRDQAEAAEALHASTGAAALATGLAVALATWVLLAVAGGGRPLDGAQRVSLAGYLLAVAYVCARQVPALGGVTGGAVDLTAHLAAMVLAGGGALAALRGQTARSEYST